MSMQEVSFENRLSQVQLRMDTDIEAYQKARSNQEPKLNVFQRMKSIVSQFFNYTITTFSPSHREEQRKAQLGTFFDAVKSITNSRTIIRG